jgi:hypothetical protein
LIWHGIGAVAPSSEFGNVSTFFIKFEENFKYLRTLLRGVSELVSQLIR